MILVGTQISTSKIHNKFNKSSNGMNRRELDVGFFLVFEGKLIEK